VEGQNAKQQRPASDDDGFYDNPLRFSSKKVWDSRLMNLAVELF
jgi:hypothetical protein